MGRRAWRAKGTGHDFRHSSTMFGGGERERERESARDLRGVGLGTGSPEEGKPRDKIGLDSAGLHNTVQ